MKTIFAFFSLVLFAALVVGLCPNQSRAADCPSYFSEALKDTPLDPQGASKVASTMKADEMKARELKASGKYAEAAALHPQALCRAVYLVNAAAQCISQDAEAGRDSEGNFLYNAITDKSKDLAEKYLKAAEAELGKPDGYCCSGTTVESIKAWISKMRTRMAKPVTP